MTDLICPNCGKKLGGFSILINEEKQNIKKNDEKKDSRHSNIVL